MIVTVNIMAKTFAGLSATIIATRRRPVLILHFEEKYTKMDCKNEIYMKNWIKSTWIAKSQLWQKINDQLCQSQSQRLKSQLPKVKVKLEMT